MQRKLIINESEARMLISRSILEEASNDILKSKEFKDAVVSAIKNNRDFSNATEKEVKEIVSKCVSELFKTLWQRNNFWRDTIKNA